MNLQSLYYGAVRASGLSAVARHLSRRPLILCYHNVVPAGDASAGDALGLHLPVATFARQMRWLARTYDVVSLGDLLSRCSRGASLRGFAALTFDDGYAGVFEHALPVLRELGLPATVFVIAEAPERNVSFWWENPDVLRAYSPTHRDEWLGSLRGDSTAIGASVVTGNGATRSRFSVPASRIPATWSIITAATRSGLQLGVHSATHRTLPMLDETELQREIVKSRDIIGNQTGVTPEFFAYPYGIWNSRVRDAVRAAGYRAAFTLESGPHARTLDPWALPRMSIPARIGDAAFQAWTAGLNPRRGRDT